MPQKQIRVTVGCLISVLLVCLFGCVLAFLRIDNCIGVIETCPPPRTFGFRELALPLSLFPAASQDSSLYIDEDIGPDTANQEISWRSEAGKARYYVTRYNSITEAVDDFARYHEMKFPPGSMMGHTSLTYVSPWTKDFFLGCEAAETYHCLLSARYEEFTVDFSATIDSDVTEAQFQRIVEYIDQQYADRLDLR